MYKSVFVEKHEAIRGFFDRYTNDARLGEAVNLERQLRHEYEQRRIDDSTLMSCVESSLGLNFVTGLDDPLCRFIKERVYHLYGRQGKVSDGKSYGNDYINEAAQRIVSVVRLYLAIAESAFGPVERKERYPLNLLNEIVSWVDFSGNDGDPGKPKLFIAADYSELAGTSGSEFVSGIPKAIAPDGKAFVLGENREIAEIVADIAGLDPRSYPNRVVLERGLWSIDYFVSEYIRRNGFSPLMNVIMTFLKEETGFRPHCNIEQEKNQWLVKIDFATKGFLPED